MRIKSIENAIRLVGDYKVIVWDYYEVNEKTLPVDLAGVVLSGSTAHLRDLNDRNKFDAEIEFIRQIDVPLLGICFGHQLIGVTFGASVYTLEKAVKEFNSIKLIALDDIFCTWEIGTELQVTQSHKDCLSRLPDDFFLLAQSQSCQVEAMKHKMRPIYGIQAHIERFTFENLEGIQILKNFLERVVIPHRMLRILEKTSQEIKQSIIDTLRYIQFDVVSDNYSWVESKLKVAQHLADAWQLKTMNGVLVSIQG